MPERHAITALIVDDEPVARQKIRDYLKRDHEIDVVGECGLGSEAVRGIQSSRPNLVFLDIQMPDMSGLEVIEAAGPEGLPVIVFITAHDRYAVQAFEMQALDYLLKPFSRARFEKATARAKTQIRNGQSSVQQIQSVLEQLRKREPYLQRFVVKSAGSISFLRVDEVERIESEENYVRIYTSAGSHLLRAKISAIEEQLDPHRFRRIHRSTIVNIDEILKAQPNAYGDYAVTMKSGAEVTLSRGYRTRLKDLLE